MFIVELRYFISTYINNDIYPFDNETVLLFDATCKIRYKGDMKGMLGIFFILFFCIIINVYGTNKFEEEIPSGDVFIDLHNEIQKSHFPQIKPKNDNTLFLDKISNGDSRKRLVYWLNFRDSNVVKLDVKTGSVHTIAEENLKKRQNNSASIFSPPKEEEAATIAGQNFNPPIESNSAFKSVASFNNNKNPKSKVSPKALLSYRDKNMLVHSAAEDGDFVDRSQNVKTDFLTIFGVRRNITPRQDVNVNLLVERRDSLEKEFVFRKAAFSYEHRLPVSRSFLLVPRLSMFVPITYYENEVYEGSMPGITASPSIGFNTLVFNAAELSYDVYYYQNTRQGKKRSLLNTIKLNTQIKKTIGLVYGVAGLKSWEEESRASQFMTVYYKWLTKFSRDLKLSVTAENYFKGGITYMLNLSYNY